MDAIIAPVANARPVPEPRWNSLFSPLRIKGLTLKNRVMSTSHAPGYAEGGKPGKRYVAYHEEKARGGLALTAFGGSSSVSVDSPAAQWRQISVASDEIVPAFRAFADRIHAHGAALMCQLSHLGHRSHFAAENWLAPIAPSPVREPAHRSFPREMDRFDIARVVEDFGHAARRCRDGGLDGSEIISSGAHLIGQFLSPATNRRDDEYGGSVENRMRFGLEVFRSIRKQAGEDFVAGLRLSSDEMAPEALGREECLEIAVRFAQSGLVDFLTISTAQNASALGLARSIPGMWAEPHPYVALAGAIRREAGIPVFHAGRMLDLDQADVAVAAGHVDMAGMTRAHIADPHLVRKALAGLEADIRPCVGANYCVERLHLGGVSLCIHNVATGRETVLPQAIEPAPARLRVAIVGAGPGGLEAARVCAERGHAVTLLEAEQEVGGQLRSAARAPWRRPLGLVPAWLEGRLRRLGVDIRLATPATRDTVLALRPDVVLIATGGLPNKGRFEGADLAVSARDILDGRAEAAADVLLFDDNGYNQGLSCAEALLEAGSRVEIVTPERALGVETTASNYAIHLRHIYAGGGRITPDERLVRIEREPSSNRLVATLRNEFAQTRSTRTVDQVVVEHGTLPLDDLFQELAPLSTNEGKTDWEAFVALRPQPRPSDAKGSFGIFRLGDALASRDVHAAMYDAMRISLPLGTS